MGERTVNKSYGSEREIDLSGNFPPNKQRSLLKPIQAFNTGQFIEVVFNAAQGAIVITVYDETENVVYLQSVTGSAGQQVFIDITSFGVGEYTIELVDSQGRYLSGRFEI